MPTDPVRFGNPVDSADPTDSADSTDPTDALSVLADETRLAILRTLADADEPLPFSRLRERTGVRDSGRFSYHLRQLCEYFVRDSDEGYELGHAGARLIDATNGAGDAPADVPLADTDECPVCGDPDCEKLIHVHLSSPV
jgi:DNA-binding transcriptional ArsR family regulator